MKKIALTMMMFAGLLTSCSVDDESVFNESNVGNENIATYSTEDAGNCITASDFDGTAMLSSYTGPEIVFNWNNAVAHAADKTYVSYIEIINDATCPAPAGAVPVEAIYPIDVFNTSSLEIAGVSAKCFYWRIVINTYSGSVLDCTAQTEWKGATYVVD